MAIELMQILPISELIFLGIYALFSYLVSHQDDFYKSRRWKAAITISILGGFFILLGMLVPVIISFSDAPAAKASHIESLFTTVTLTLVCIIPQMFLTTIVVYYQVAFSDDLLDKIWKDPSKGNKNPIQPF